MKKIWEYRRGRFTLKSSVFKMCDLAEIYWAVPAKPQRTSERDRSGREKEKREEKKKERDFSYIISLLTEGVFLVNFRKGRSKVFGDYRT